MRDGKTLLLSLLAAAWLAAPALAQDSTATAAGPRAERQEALPDELEGVGIDEHPGAQVPLDLVFTDQDGRRVALGDLVDGSRPVILNLMYMKCPMLCGLIGQGLVDALEQMKLTAGDEFRVLSVSFDPTDTPTMARAKRQEYLREYGRPGAAQGWTWLVGDEPEIRALTEAVGFEFRWNQARQEFAHAAALVILTPQGKVSRYLYGIQFPPRTLRLSLVEAADGKTGSTVDKILLFCFQYDAEAGRYGPAVRNLMKAGGLITVLAVGGLIWGLRRREKRRAASS